MSDKKINEFAGEKLFDEELGKVNGGFGVWLADRSAGVVTCPQCGGTEITKGDDGMYLCSCGNRFAQAGSKARSASV